jgi:hypothetical protein
VGRQTIIDHVEVIANADDGVEFFGGTVNCKNLVVAFCGDDAFDLDQGYRGKGQFWLGIHNNDKCLEITGGLQPVQLLTECQAVIYNATLIRSTLSSMAVPVHFLQYGGGYLKNSIILNPMGGVALRYSDKPGDTWSLFQSGRLALKNNILYPGSGPTTAYHTYSELGVDLTEENQQLTDSTLAWQTSFEDPGISDLDGFTLLPPTTEFENMAPYECEWFEEVTYKGSFGSNLWIAGWTLLYESGYIND